VNGALIRFARGMANWEIPWNWSSPSDTGAVQAFLRTQRWELCTTFSHVHDFEVKRICFEATGGRSGMLMVDEGATPVGAVARPGNRQAPWLASPSSPTDVACPGFPDFGGSPPLPHPRPSDNPSLVSG
jgi:hypothetical protein